MEDLGLSDEERFDWLLTRRAGTASSWRPIGGINPSAAGVRPLDLSLRPGCLYCGADMTHLPSKAKLCLAKHAAQYRDRGR